MLIIASSQFKNISTPMKIKSLSFIMLAALATASIQSCSPDRAKAYNNRTNVDANGLAFIKGAHEGGLTEIEASKIAQKNSTNKEVTDFAAMMIKDHSEAGVEIDTLADHKYVYLRDSVNHEHKELLDSLAKKTGPEFDKAYITMMVKDHEEASELFKANKESNYTDIEEIAKKYAPTIEEHLKTAKSIQASLK
jgi:putative membrane protein